MYTTRRILSSMSQQGFKVYVTQPIPSQAIEILKSNGVTDLIVNEKTPLSRQDLLRNVSNHSVDGLFCTLNERIDKELLDVAGSKLKVIATCSVGYDHVDVAECTKRNIPVGFTPGVLTDATAELAVALLLNTSRRVTESVLAAKKGEWADWKIMWMCGKGLAGSTVGVFGLGRIGLAIARRIENFGISRLIYHNRNPSEEGERRGYKHVDLDTLLSESDFVICSCAATKLTERVFNKELFSKMKSSGLFVNISRGICVNQDDLYDALSQGVIAAAGLDVTTPEPLPPTHKLFQLSNCVITPHIASAETNTRVLMATITAQNLVNALNSKPMLHQINKET